MDSLRNDVKAVLTEEGVDKEVVRRVDRIIKTGLNGYIAKQDVLRALNSVGEICQNSYTAVFGFEAVEALRRSLFKRKQRPKSY